MREQKTSLHHVKPDNQKVGSCSCCGSMARLNHYDTSTDQYLGICCLPFAIVADVFLSAVGANCGLRRPTTAESKVFNSTFR